MKSLYNVHNINIDYKYYVYCIVFIKKYLTKSSIEDVVLTNID